jgi:dihydropteroate synthase
VSADVECARVVPVVRALVAANVRVSIDTTKPEVAEAALEAGAAIVNDTSCGASDRLLDAVSANGAELVLMHNRGRGEVDAANTEYGDVVRDVCDTLVRASAHATSRGVDPSRIWLDPGLGFAKTAAQSLCVHASLDRVVALGHPVLLGSSRKSFLAALAAEGSAPGPLPEARLGATIASALFGARTGVRGVRVHDVFEVAQALRVAHALDAARPREGSASWR